MCPHTRGCSHGVPNEVTAPATTPSLPFSPFFSPLSLFSQRSNEIVNRLNKTKVELFPNLQQEREKFDQMVKAERKAEERSRKKEELEEQRERQRQEELRSYNRIMTVRATSLITTHRPSSQHRITCITRSDASLRVQDDKMVSNKEVAAKYASFQEAEDDFM